MDYGEAIDVLGSANEKFEFPVHWGVDLQSEDEHHPTEKYAKKLVIVIKRLKSFTCDRTTTAVRSRLAPWIGEIIVGSQPTRRAARQISRQLISITRGRRFRD